MPSSAAMSRTRGTRVAALHKEARRDLENPLASIVFVNGVGAVFHVFGSHS